MPREPLDPAEIRLGAVTLSGGQARFFVWAPFASSVDVLLLTSPRRVVPMTPMERGYFQAQADGVLAGTRYRYQLDGSVERPDPASRYQPEGVHGPSELVSDDFAWTDAAWSGIPLRQNAIYELHVGTFTEASTFEAVIPRLPTLGRLGVTAVELMPVAQFPGARNWGYDGVYPYAVQNSYGGPTGLRTLVNACHAKGLAVVLDVVYNHLGPEGNYLADFAPYFTDRYQTPWGRALNFDGPDSDEVRRFFIESALRFVDEFHVDALRLDAVHAIVDHSAHPFLQELAEAVQARARELGRQVYVIAESDLNDPRLIRSRDAGGYGLDAQWSDDLHHALHALLTGENTGYYADFGQVEHLARAFRQAYVYMGEYSTYRRRHHGAPTAGLTADRFVVAAQNHDQVGNRLLGDRLSALVSFEALKLAAGVVLLSPFVPLLFMGEEYGEISPFQYFVSHSDPQLVDAVRQGRRSDFAASGWAGEVPDPQDLATFVRSRINWDSRHTEPHRTLLRLYHELLALRARLPALREGDLERVEATVNEAARLLTVRRWTGGNEALALFNFSTQAQAASLSEAARPWRLVVHSAEARWRGPLLDAGDATEYSGRGSFTVGPEAFALFVAGDVS